MKKMIQFLLATLIFLVNNIPIYAFNEEELTQIELEALRQANIYISSLNESTTAWENVEIIDSKILYDFNDNENGVFFRVSDGETFGYINVLNSQGSLEVLESCRDGILPFDFSIERIYCVSPLYYFYKENNEFICFGNEMNIGNMSDFESTEIIYDDISSYALIQPVTGYTYYRLNTIPTSMTQPTGLTCTPTALAMLTRYLDSNGYGNLVADGTSNSSLINTLKSSSYLGSDSTTISELKTGWKKYYNEKGYQITLKSKHAELNASTANRLVDSDISTYIIPSIQNDWPLIVMIGYYGYKYADDRNAVFSGPTTALHALTVYGVMISTDGDEDILVAKDPWNGNSVELRWVVTNSASQPYFYIYSMICMTDLS